MSDAPTTAAPPPPPRPRSEALIGAAFTMSLLLNGLLLLGVSVLALVLYLGSGPADDRPVQQQYAGDTRGKAKVAVVHIEGVILEGTLDFAYKQLDEAARDADIKAVVLRLNTPGGSITASDDLHRRICELRDGNPARNRPGKPLVVSMASLAAWGYYIAVPAKKVLAERTTMTGSIGVYAAFPNVTELGHKIGFQMDIIKQGEVKASGSPFHFMTPQERQVWQDLVDHAYAQFLSVVEEGRPHLKGKLREVVYRKELTAEAAGDHQPIQYERRLADGGVYTAQQALEFGLIDQIGYLDDAVAEARKLASLPDNARVIRYEKPATLLGSLLGVRTAPAPAGTFDPAHLSAGATPRLWYMAPQSELAGWLTVVGH